MIKNEDQYKIIISGIETKLKDLRISDIRARYIYREKTSVDSVEEVVEFNTENMEIQEEARRKMLFILKEEFKKMKDESTNLHTDYKLEYPITKGNVGILNEESYPKELEDLISAFSLPDPDGKRRSVKNTKKTDKIPIAFMIEFCEIFYVKKVEKIKIASGKNLEKSLIFGTKSHKITTFEEDFLLIILTEPDFIVYRGKDSKDPTFVYNSTNLGKICATYEFMKRKIRASSDKLQKVLDDPNPLFEYLDRAWTTIHSVYFTINGKGFSQLNPKYLKVLKDKFYGGKLVTDTSGRLITQGLRGKDIYNILLNRYGVKIGQEGEEQKGIIGQFENMP